MPMHRPMRYTDTKQKTDFKAIGKIFRYCKPYSFAIVVSMILAILATITTIIGPNKIRELTDYITEGITSNVNLEAITYIAITLIIIYSLGAVLNYIQQYILAIVSQRTAKKLRTDIDTKINRLPLSYFDKSTTGDILSRVTNDVDLIAQTLGASIANLISAIVLFVGVVIMMFVTNWLLSLVTIVSSLLGFAFLGILLKRSQKHFVNRQIFLGKMNGHIEEIYSNYILVRSYNAHKAEKSKFDEINKNLLSTEWKSQFLSGLMRPIMHFIGNLSYSLIFIVGVAIILSGSDAVTIGTLIAFIIYAKLFTEPLQTFAQSLTQLQQTSAASTRVFEILAMPELADESHKTTKLTTIKGDVEFKHVRFGYTKDKPVIKDLSFKAKAGQKIAIVGPTGAGKTTIVNLLMRFYEVDDGEILIDNISTKDISRYHLHELFDMILQDTWIFNGTLRENLVYNKTGVTDAELEKICSAVGLNHFVDTLPERFDTYFSDTSTISAGQRQQLTIARAMLKNSPLLILDEATSNVDTRTEKLIQNAMDTLTKGRTSFVIAHRLSTIKNADLILVIKDGDIIEQGKHHELYVKNGYYTQLYNSQFEDTNSQNS